MIGAFTPVAAVSQGDTLRWKAPRSLFVRYSRPRVWLLPWSVYTGRNKDTTTTTSDAVNGSFFFLNDHFSYFQVEKVCQLQFLDTR